MDQAILATKLYVPPSRPNWVLRPRLLHRLNASLHAGSKLTLVAAPAGFGKTTLITEWLTALQSGPVTAQAAWLSLDAGDNDLARFLHYLIAALRTRAPQAGELTLNLLQQSSLPPFETLLLPLVNDLAQLTGPLVLVLDDYHVIQLPVIHEALAFLIEHQPPLMHVAITTRQDPLLPLARWRARGLLTEIRLKDLRFSAAETGEFLNGAMGFALHADDVAALESRTEGWIAGLQLAAVSLLQADLSGEDGLAEFVESFTGNDRFVMDYLIDEVLDRQPESIQRFLLQTSVLERFNADLCQAVVADDAPTSRLLSSDPPSSRTEETLRYLEQVNLFLIPLDNQREWYRYHHLFADLLQHRLANSASTGLPASASPDITGGRARASVLRQRASAWFAAHELADEAIHYAQAAGDWELSSQHITRFAPALMQRGQQTQVLRWVNGLPDSVIRGNPFLCRTYGYVLTVTGKLEQGALYLNLAQQMNRDDPRHLGSTLAFASYNANFRAEFEEEIQQSQRALTLLPADMHWERGIAAISLGIGLCHTDDPHGCEAAMREAYDSGRKSGTLRTCFFALTYLGRMNVLHLRFGQAQEEFEQAYSMQINGQSYPACDVALLDLAQLKYEQNELEQAQAYIERGLEANRFNGSIEMRAYGLRLSARLAQLRGETELAQEYLQKTLALAKDYNLSPLTLSLNAAMNILMALSEDRLADADRAAVGLMQGIGKKTAGLYSFIFYPELARVQLRLRQGRQVEAQSELDSMLWRAQQPGWEFPRVQVRLLQALAESSPSQAQQYLREALALAAPGPAVRCFVDLGAPMRALLTSLRPHLKPGESDFADRVLRAFGPAADNQATAPAGGETLVEPLTERELEVLRLLAEGLTNIEIAERLYLSPNTLKAHTQNIYSKMDVHSRVQVVNKARQLGLI